MLPQLSIFLLLTLVLFNISYKVVHCQKENAKMVRVKLTRIPPRIHVNLIDVKANPLRRHCPRENVFESKYVPPSSPMSPPLSRNMKLPKPVSYSYYQTDWYGEIGLGTPPQKFKALFATNSQLTLVPTIQCMTPACLCHDYFVRSNSSTYRQSYVNIHKSTYKNQTLRGRYAFDSLSIGDSYTVDNTTTNGSVQIQNLLFAELDDHIPGQEYDMHDVILGLHPLNWPYDSPTVLMFNQRKLKDLKISYYLEQGEGWGNGGEILFGGVDYSKIKGNISYSDFIHQNDIKIRMHGVEISRNGEMLGIVCRTGCRAKIDTGTKSIHGPTTEVAKINAFTGALRVSPSFAVFPTCNISGLPTITFNINGTRYPVLPEQYVIRYEVPYDRNVCISAIEEVGSRQWTLGQTFLQNFYTVYDHFNHRIGFAERDQGHGVEIPREENWYSSLTFTFAGK